MIETKITIGNKYGLHARAAAKFVNAAKAFSSSISIGPTVTWWFARAT